MKNTAFRYGQQIESRFLELAAGLFCIGSPMPHPFEPGLSLGVAETLVYLDEKLANSLWFALKSSILRQALSLNDIASQENIGKLW